MFRKRYKATCCFVSFSEAFPLYKINFDLSDCDKVLRVEGDNMEALRIMIPVRSIALSEILDQQQKQRGTIGA